MKGLPYTERTVLRKRLIVKVVASAICITCGITSVSLGMYVIDHPDQSLVESGATWARNHGLSPIVDRLEMWKYRKPPSTVAAEELALDGDQTEDIVSPTSTLASQTTVPTPTTLPPEPLSTPVTPTLANEGKWKPLVTINGETVMWKTSVRPLAEFASVVATAALIDQTKVHAALFNGPDVPGKGDWTNWSSVTKKAVPSLIAAFNGGFRLQHIKGGYFTEGKVVRKLRNDEATLGVKKDGTLAVGIYGRDIKNDGSWTSLRQNLPPVVTNGKISIKNYPGTYWGNNYHNVLYGYRTGICTRNDGRLMYIMAGDVNITLLGQTMVSMGCVTGMQLDINGHWCHFATFTNFGTNDRKGVLLDKRMKFPQRYLKSYDKDFIAIFDPSTLPAGVLG